MAFIRTYTCVRIGSKNECIEVAAAASLIYNSIRNSPRWVKTNIRSVKYDTYMVHALTLLEVEKDTCGI